MNKQEALEFLEQPFEDIVYQAAKVKRQYIGDRFETCSIINAKSGSCSEDCKFCAQSAHHKTDVDIYPLLDKEKIFEDAKIANENGAGRFGIVTSGNDLTEDEIKAIADVTLRIKNELGIKICGSLGALSKESLQSLKYAGMSRYHHNIETSRNFYPKIVSTHDFDERIKTIADAKAVGFEVCSGGILGLGESWEDRIDMALLLKELEVDAVPLNVLMPLKGTQIYGIDPISPIDVIKTIAMFRMIVKDKTIKVAAGRETVMKDYQALAFLAGANGMLVGGYLTVKGRKVEEDKFLIREIINCL